MDIFLGLIACIAAVFVGAYLAKKQARAFRSQDQQSSHVNFFDYGDVRFLHCGSPAVQGSMRISKPFDIHLEYQQRMMGWLLFTDLAKINQLHAMQLGLGAGSLTKFCNQTLGMQTTAVELNPQVIEMCRRWFFLPEDNHSLEVIQGDAAEIILRKEWIGKIDVLQVDLYDQDAQCPVLDTEQFYGNCKQILTANGVMTVNVFGLQSNIHESANKIAKVFGNSSVWKFKPTTAGNSIIIALGAPSILSQDELTARALAIEARCSLPASQWIKALVPPALSST